MSAARWIALHCGDETAALLENYPNAFLLLAQIAMRAQWKDCPIRGMKEGQALIGDWKAAGLHSKKAYEVAKKRLETCKLATFQGGNRGTRATLTDSRVFSLSAESRGEPRENQRGNRGETEGQPRENPRGSTNTEYTETQRTKTPFLLDGASSSPPLIHSLVTTGQSSKAPKRNNSAGTAKKSELVKSIWDSAPQRARTRSSKGNLEKEIERIPFDELPSSDEIMVALEAWKNCSDWTKENGEFIPGIHRWIKERQWENTPPPNHHHPTAQPSPETAQDSRTAEICAQINALCPEWGKPAHWSDSEIKTLQGSLAQFSELEPADWSLLRSFLAAQLDTVAGYWQPNTRGRFVSTFPDVLASAQRWSIKHGPPKPKPKPEGNWR